MFCFLARCIFTTFRHQAPAMQLLQRVSAFECAASVLASLQLFRQTFQATSSLPHSSSTPLPAHTSCKPPAYTCVSNIPADVSSAEAELEVVWDKTDVVHMDDAMAVPATGGFYKSVAHHFYEV